MDANRQTLSILQACREVGVSRRTIYNWLATGKVEYVRTAGGAVRIFSDSLWRTPDAGAFRPPRSLKSAIQAGV
jgi:excisionase family DNA binding protein